MAIFTDECPRAPNGDLGHNPSTPSVEVVFAGLLDTGRWVGEPPNWATPPRPLTSIACRLRAPCGAARADADGRRPPAELGVEVVNVVLRIEIPVRASLARIDVEAAPLSTSVIANRMVVPVLADPWVRDLCQIGVSSAAEARRVAVPIWLIVDEQIAAAAVLVCVGAHPIRRSTCCVEACDRRGVAPVAAARRRRPARRGRGEDRRRPHSRSRPPACSSLSEAATYAT
jgi:hypothetical protein